MKESLLPDKFDLESVLKSNEGLHGVKLAEKLKKEYGKYAAFVAEQIKLRSKAESKLPGFAKRSCLYNGKSLEQSSSEPLAEFKARRFKGKRLLDLSGGLGADDAAFSRSFNEIISVDNDAELNEIARYNFSRLRISNVKRVDSDAYDYADMCVHKPGTGNERKFDLVYLDADRRANADKKRSVTLHDSEPSILKIKDVLFELSKIILLKLSPLIDLTYLVKTLPGTKIIYVVSLNNEVKEILALLEYFFSGIPEVKAIDITIAGKEREFSGKLNEPIRSEYSAHGRYFYEPATALIKSGLAAKYAAWLKLRLPAKNSLYMLGDELIDDFFGRKFEIISRVSFSKSNVKKYLHENNITRANVSKRNFPLSADEISKLFRLKDGGDEYLFFTRDAEEMKLMFHAKKAL